VRQQGAVAAFGFTAPQIIAWDAVTFVGASRSPSDVCARGVSLLHIRVKRRPVENDRRLAPLVGHNLALAVWGQERAKLALKGSKLLISGLTATRPSLKRFPRSVRDQSERPVRALLGDDIRASPITAELDVCVGLHGKNDGTQT
jgi:hypothetical protein